MMARSSTSGTSAPRRTGLHRGHLECRPLLFDTVCQTSHQMHRNPVWADRPQNQGSRTAIWTTCGFIRFRSVLPALLPTIHSPRRDSRSSRVRCAGLSVEPPMRSFVLVRCGRRCTGAPSSKSRQSTNPAAATLTPTPGSGAGTDTGVPPTPPTRATPPQLVRARLRTDVVTSARCGTTLHPLVGGWRGCRRPRR